MDIWQDESGWRAAGMPRTVLWQHAAEVTSYTALRNPDGAVWDITSTGGAVRVEILDGQTALVDGNIARVTRKADGRMLVRWKNRSYHITPAGPPDVLRAGSSAGSGVGTVTAPMPGRVVKLHAEAGTVVTQHQPLLVLESMKIEHVVTAPRAGTLAKLNVSAGAQVRAGAILAEIGPEG
jgi:biotin carboxyl carrier protein